MKNSVTAGILSGLLLVVSYQFVGVLSFVAYVPLLLWLVQRTQGGSHSSPWIGIYLTFFIYHAGTNWWISSWQERTDPYLFASGIALIVIHPLFLSLPFIALASIAKRIDWRWMLAGTPFAITGFEWLHGQTDASYPWLTSGYALVDTPYAQLAEYGGVYGLSLIIAFTNAVLCYWIVYHKTVPTRLRWIILAAAMHIVMIAFGWWRGEQFSGQQTVNQKSGTALDVHIVQPNEDPWDKWTDAREQVRILQQITDSARMVTRAHARSAGSSIMNHSALPLFVWPETAIPYTITKPLYNIDRLALMHWIDTSNIALLTGFADWVQYEPGTAPPSAKQRNNAPAYDVFNAAMLIKAGQQQTGSQTIHRKTMLTPFAERLPFADQLSFAMQWFEWGVGISSWGKGQQRIPLAYNANIQIGVIICIESVYPEVSRDLVNNGANVLAVLTNDAWYNGTWGPQQHYNIARMRAIEMRRCIIRCANSGVSGFILPDGSTIRESGSVIAPMKRGAIAASIAVNNDKTVYAIIGDVLSPISLGLTVILLICARIPLLVRKMQAYHVQQHRE